MDVEELKEAAEENLEMVAEKARHKPDPTKVAFVAGIVFIILILCAIIFRVWNYSALIRKNQELEETQAQLAESEQELLLLKESTNALKEQVSGLSAEKEDLNNKLEELLNVQQTTPTIDRSTLEDGISSLSELVTKKYWYRNATQQKEAKEWLWGANMPFSDIKFVAMYDGYITAGIDLKEVKFDVNEAAKTITVSMPKSKIFDHNIPQETINVVEVKNNLFNSVSFDDYNRFISGEKEVMEETAIGKGILEEADKEARQVLDAFLKTIPGIDRYKIVFQ